MSENTLPKLNANVSSASSRCSAVPCHCGGALAEYIVGPMANGNEYTASEKCALMHVMAGWKSRTIALTNKTPPIRAYEHTDDQAQPWIEKPTRAGWWLVDGSCGMEFVEVVESPSRGLIARRPGVEHEYPAPWAWAGRWAGPVRFQDAPTHEETPQNENWVAALAKIVESAQVIAKDLKQSHYFYTSTRVSRVADAAAELQRKIESAATAAISDTREQPSTKEKNDQE